MRISLRRWNCRPGGRVGGSLLSLLPGADQLRIPHVAVDGLGLAPSGGALDETVTRLEYDLFYIKNMSLSLDTYIIFQSLKAVLLPEAPR